MRFIQLARGQGFEGASVPQRGRGSNPQSPEQKVKAAPLGAAFCSGSGTMLEQ